LEDRDAIIAWVAVLFQETVVDFEVVVGTNLQVENLVEIQRESIGVGENNFLAKRECYLSSYSKSIYNMFEGSS